MKNETIRSNMTAQILKVMGHPVRVAIIKLLAKTKRMSVNEISKALEVHQSVVSHHLNTLKNKGALRSERVGQNTFYLISHPGITNAVNCILEVLKE